MHKIVAFAMLALFSMFAEAQQQCTSGIYMKVGLSPSFYSVTVNGDSAITVGLSYLSGTLALTYTGYGTTRSSQVGIWSYMMGSWDGANYRLAGETVQGACHETTHGSCDASGNATFELDSMTQTAAGASWGFNCQKAFTDTVNSGQNVAKYTRIF